MSHADFHRDAGAVRLLMHPVKSVGAVFERQRTDGPRLLIRRDAVRLKGWRELRRTPADQLRLLLQTQHAQRRGIAIDHSGVIGEQQAVVGMLEDQTKTLVRFLAFGDVLARRHDPGRGTISIQYA